MNRLLIRALLVAALLVLPSASALGQDRAVGIEERGEVAECDPSEDGVLFGILPGILAGVIWGHATEGAGIGGLTPTRFFVLSGAVGGVTGFLLDHARCNPTNPDSTDQEESEHNGLDISEEYRP